MKTTVHIMNKALFIALLATLELFANQDSISSAIQEPPSGNKQFYTGLGLTLGGLSSAILGIWVLSSVRPDSMSYGPRDIYGNPHDSTKISNDFGIWFGVALTAVGVGLDAFGIPLLIKGKRLKEEKKRWLDKNQVSLQINVHKNLFGLRTTINF